MPTNVLGAGIMGRQLAALFVMVRQDVVVWSRRPADAVQPEIERQLKLLQRKLGPVEKTGLLRVESRIAALPAALTIEALPEDLAIKQGALREISFDLAGQSVFTNSSSLRPAAVHPAAIGLHFFNPVYAMKMLELSAPEESLRTDARELLASLRALGFDVLNVKDNAGYVGNYILFSEIGAVFRLIQEHGYQPAAIDAVLRHLGRTAATLDIVDLVGVDVCVRILENLAAHDAAFSVPVALREAMQAGVLGNKNRTSIRKFLEGRRIS